jgi:N-acetylmuramoyl-L-alanine amidase.
LNLDMAKRLKRMLEEAGATVVMTRTSDQYYSLYYRAAFANKYILDSELSKKLEEKESMEEEYDKKTEQKLKMEAEKLES